MTIINTWFRHLIERPCIVWMPLCLLISTFSSTTYPAFLAYKPVTTYDKFLGPALSGNPDAQTFIGFMLFHGEGVEQDMEEAHYWFHQAAEQGSVIAQRNLGILHSRALKSFPEVFEDAEEANYWFSKFANSGNGGRSEVADTSRAKFFSNLDESLESASTPEQAGQQIFSTFCAGCHGFNGIAAYPSAPSFARGERLDKSDKELMESMLNGLGVMPSWQGTLSTEMLLSTLTYIRNRLHTPENSEVENDDSMTSDSASASGRSVEAIYVRYCAGCHGLNGVAYYVNSPSFALGQRLEKSDEELAGSIRNGIGEMPKWGVLIDPDVIPDLVVFVRELQRSFQRGIMEPLHDSPDLYYLFRNTDEHMRNRAR